MLSSIDRDKFPGCYSFRRRSVFSLKLFDLLEISAGRRVVYLDSDVLFLNKPETLLRALQSHNPLRGHYLRDITYSHSWTTEGIERVLGLRLNSDAPLNSGLLALDAESPDYELFEKLLALQGENGYAEQTMWWALLERRGASPLPPEYDVCFRHAWRNLDRSKAREEKTVGEEVIFQHYCGNAVIKGMFYDAVLSRPELWN
jgi:lipopolysaccharide biosynthesis glycosyltransferase